MPGKELLRRALKLIGHHPVVAAKVAGETSKIAEIDQG
jgi:hypothetical protein